MAFTQEELQNLSDLFLSVDDNNTRIAFEIMDQQDFPTDLLTELFVVFKLTQNKEFRKKAEDLLKEHGSTALQKAMKRKLELSGRGYSAPTEKKIKENIKKYVKGNELEGLKFAQAMYNKYGKAISYLLDESEAAVRSEILKKFKKDKVFSLRGKSLTKLPKEFYDFTDLEEIDLRGNKISTISSKFKVFKNLRILRMSGNTLKKMDKCLADLPIEELYLRENLFETFPDVIAKMKSLRILDLNNATNAYEFKPVEMPPEFQQLPNLRELIFTSDTRNRCCHEYKGYPRFSKVKSEDDKPLDLSYLALAKLAYKQNKECLHYIFTDAEPDYIREVLKDYYNAETKTMDLSGNTIINFPKELADFEIKHLIAKECRFYTPIHGLNITKEEIPGRVEHLGLLTELESVDFDQSLSAYNGLLDAVLEQLTNCKKLKYLNLHKGCSQKMPEILTRLLSLEELHYTDSSPNDLLTYPESLKNLKNLKVLYLSKVYDWDSRSYAPQDAQLPEIQKLLPNCEIKMI